MIEIAGHVLDVGTKKLELVAELETLLSVADVTWSWILHTFYWSF